MDWWMIGALVWLILGFWAWACCRVGAKAHEDWDRIVADLNRKEADRANKGA